MNAMLGGTTECESAEQRTKWKLRYKAWIRKTEIALKQGKEPPPMPKFLKNLDD